jgi:threonine synthase
MSHFEILCSHCGRPAEAGAVRCASCSGALTFEYDDDTVAWDESRRGVWRYRSLLPVADPAHIVSLGEGDTPLLRSRTRPGVSFKDETRNPTGSHKDRALSLSLSQATAQKRTLSVVISAGSTGISNAAMSTRAGIPSLVLAPRGTALERLHPVQELGARVVVVDDDIDSAFVTLQGLAASVEGLNDSSTVRSSNPYQAEAAKTIAYELVEQWGVPNWIVVPMGGGGTAAGIWRGFLDLQRLGRIDTLPRLLGAVAGDYDAFARAMASDVLDPDDAVDPNRSYPPTALAKIAHIYPPDGVEGLHALRASGGTVHAVTDAEAFEAQARFGREEGIFIEPSSAVCLAALDRAIADDTITPEDEVVVLLSGSGFREAFLTLRERPVTPSAFASRELRSLVEAMTA